MPCGPAARGTCLAGGLRDLPSLPGPQGWVHFLSPEIWQGRACYRSPASQASFPSWLCGIWDATTEVMGLTGAVVKLLRAQVQHFGERERGHQWGMDQVHFHLSL